ncbi:hypothetical protein C8R44DRAFT_650392, partial [Mycena epipterygia]
MASKKRKSTGGEIRRPTKKAKTAAHPPIIDSGYGAPSRFIPSQRAPVGMVWDSRDHSCGYDSTFTILANMWAEDSARWHNVFSNSTPLLRMLSEELLLAVSGDRSLEQCRDAVRSRLHAVGPDLFPYGPNPTSIDRIAMAMLPS